MHHEAMSPGPGVMPSCDQNEQEHSLWQVADFFCYLFLNAYASFYVYVVQCYAVYVGLK